MTTALGSVLLKHYLERPRANADTRPKEGSPPIEPTIPRSSLAGCATSFVRTVLVLVVSFSFGAWYNFYKQPIGNQEQVAFALFCVFVVISFVALVLFHRRSRRGFWPYQLDAFALWAAFASGFSVFFGRLFDEVFIMTGFIWLGVAVAGGIIILITRPRYSTT
jgi:hypothetical protein